MRKIILLSVALASFLVAADHNKSDTKKPLKAEEQEYNEKVFKRIDEKISEIYRRLEENKNIKASGGTGLDATTLPLMQGSYTISKNGKPHLSEVYAQDSGGGDMYLNKNNNMIISHISDDHTTYKVGGTMVKTPVVFNNQQTPKSTNTVIKPEINTVSQTSSSSSNLLMPPPLPKTIRKEDF